MTKFRSRRLNSDILIFAALLLFSFIFGFSFGNVGNHGTYLADGMRMARPELLANDWWATETTHYHKVFSIVVYLASLTGELPWVLALLNSLTIAGVLIVLFVLLRTIESGRAAFALVFLLALIAHGGTSSAGGTYIISSGLQASSFGALFLMIAILAFVRGSHAWSGLWLALSGLFHTNYLVLGIMAFGLAHLFLGREAFVRRGFAQFTLASVVLAFALPTLLAAGQSENAELVQHALINVRAPHHYLTMSFSWNLLPLAGWTLLGLSFLPFVTETDEFRRRYSAIYLALLALLVVSIAGTTMLFVPLVSQLFVIRLAPFAVLLAQIVLIVSALRMSQNSDFLKSWLRSPIRLLLAAVGGILLLRYHIYFHPIVSVPFLFTTAVFACLAAIALQDLPIIGSLAERWRRLSAAVPRIAVALLFVVGSGVGVARSYSAAALINPEVRPEVLALYDWARRTEPEALFIIPPDLGPLDDFRIQGERAVIVDWKSIPMMTDEMIEWWERWTAILGVETIESLDEAKGLYRNLSKDQVLAVMERFDADYIVFFQPYEESAGPGPVSFQNETFVVFSRADRE